VLLAIGKLGQLDFDFWMGSKFSVSGAAWIQGRLRVRDQQTDPEEPRGGRRSPRLQGQGRRGGADWVWGGNVDFKARRWKRFQAFEVWKI